MSVLKVLRPLLTVTDLTADDDVIESPARKSERSLPPPEPVQASNLCFIKGAYLGASGVTISLIGHGDMGPRDSFLTMAIDHYQSKPTYKVMYLFLSVVYLLIV